LRVFVRDKDVAGAPTLPVEGGPEPNPKETPKGLTQKPAVGASLAVFHLFFGRFLRIWDLGFGNLHLGGSP
jgi:hypothetical protein